MSQVRGATRGLLYSADRHAERATDEKGRSARDAIPSGVVGEPPNVRKPVSEVQLARARGLLAHEGGADVSSAAAGKIYEKLHTHLATLLGSVGVQALIVRSAELTQRSFAFFDASSVDDAAALRDCLQKQDPAVATDAAVVFFGTFLSLITTFIGERLTNQVLRSTWPSIVETAVTETPK